MDEHKKPNLEDNKPPVLGSWRKLYYLVLAILAIQIIIYYAITRYFQ